MREQILNTLKELQWALRAGAALSLFSRLCFFFMLGLCAVAIVLKMMGGSLSGFFVLAALLLAVGISLPRMWRFSLRRCAVLIERRLGLEERLSTCLENLHEPSTAVIDGQMRDTVRALEKADLDDVKRLQSPRELLYAGAFALVLTVILIAPNPVKSEAPPPRNRALERKAQEEREKLREEARVRTEKGKEYRKRLEKIYEQMSESSDPESTRRAFANLAEVRRMLEAALAGGGLTAQEEEELRGILSALQGAGAGLARQADPATVPADLLRPREETKQKVAEFARKAGGDAPGAGDAQAAAGASDAPRDAASERGWAPRFDPIVRRFYGDDR